MKNLTKSAICAFAALALAACGGKTDSTASPENAATAYVQALIDCDGPTLAKIVCELNGDTLSASEQEHVIRYMEHAVENNVRIPISSFTIDSVKHAADSHANAYVTYVVEQDNRCDTLHQILQTIKGPDDKWRVNKMHL